MKLSFIPWFIFFAALLMAVVSGAAPPQDGADVQKCMGRRPPQGQPPQGQPPTQGPSSSTTAATTANP
ncbi:hypothetical protein O3M35_011029 [Rhynocoris fuscipes]|uniref:Uncharacterized protein n=1 Tax=Rhynocoris fuscipes TaxID=488301 RepID=A0AAW1CTM6_9HEMI